MNRAQSHNPPSPHAPRTSAILSSKMQSLAVVAALLQVALCGHVSIRMPYLNPAGVTYVNTVNDGSLSYASVPSYQQQYAAPAFQYASPIQYAQAAVPAKVETHHVGYATAQVPAVAAVPYVKHVPTVSQVPVTRYEAQPALIEKQVDLVKPAVSSRKYEVRRPAIQKQFYDIEERVIIRPAGSAVVELDEPTSKLQKGPAVIQPVGQHAAFSYNPAHGYLAHPGPTAYPIHAQNPIYQQTEQTEQNQPQNVASTPAPTSTEEESVVVENADFRNAQNQERLYPGARLPQVSNSGQVITRSNGAPLESNNRFAAHDPSPSVISSPRTTPEENQNNQNKLIELLTARGGVTEVGFGREGAAGTSLGEAGNVRARVISATPAPDQAEPTGERVSTRRVVVSRPIETLQEYNVLEPATKIERVAVHQPTLIKTARLDHVQVHSSVPVLGKALAPTVAHASVPLFQKTISPAYQYYH